MHEIVQAQKSVTASSVYDNAKHVNKSWRRLVDGFAVGEFLVPLY